MNKMNVFLSYAKEDLSHATKLYDALILAGIDVWFDQKSLQPGENWKVTITKAISNSRYFIALLSRNVESKRGYVQKELREALEILDQFPEEEIYLIPIRLEECSPPIKRLNDLHWVDFFPDWHSGLRKLFILFGISESLAVEAFKVTATSFMRLLRTDGLYVSDPIGDMTRFDREKNCYRFYRLYLQFFSDGKVFLTSSYDTPLEHGRALLNNFIKIQPHDKSKCFPKGELIQFQFSSGYWTVYFETYPKGDQLIVKSRSSHGWRYLYHFQFFETSFFL